MGMVPFFTRFGHLAFEETRSAMVRGVPDIPDGNYGFVELYCDDIDCDCRRVMIRVMTPETVPQVWATINYAWETPEYYAAWSRNNELIEKMWGAMLDPLNPQTKYSRALLRLFESILQDEAYVKRLQRHYQMFKDDLRKQMSARKRRRKRDKRR